MTQTRISADPGIPVVAYTSELAAPRALVYRAFIDPDLVARWLGPRRLTTTIELWEPRDGGAYRFVQHDADGNEYAFRGEFRGDPSPGRIVQTFEYEGAPGHVALNTASFVERGGRTLVSVNSVYATVEERDAAYETGMAHGITESMERLDELLAELQRKAA